MNKLSMKKLFDPDESKYVNSLTDILDWVKLLNKTTQVHIKKVPMEEGDFWYYDTRFGEIVNKNKSFFKIKGISLTKKDNVVEQPVIIQDEIGYLGIICKEINGILHFLMQAKIEPGNINKIQISPTIQATKSNFTQKHGGEKPKYLDYFVNSQNYEIIVDQIQSEQSSRFYKKRNRNIIIKLQKEDNIEVLPMYNWITLTQLKKLMRFDNLINMDTRTVISCIPLCKFKNDIPLHIAKEYIGDISLLNSMMIGDDSSNVYPYIYHFVNNYKMFNTDIVKLIPLLSLKEWKKNGCEFVCNNPYSFKIIYCDIEIEGREVRHWKQPLFEAIGMATFGLFTCIDNNIRKFLIKCNPEIGCFDKLELGPAYQCEYIQSAPKDEIQLMFENYLERRKGIKFDTLLSEEGGRFYCEQNRNVIIEVEKNEIEYMPDNYIWVDYKTLNELVQINNCLNIQLRNLMAIL